MPPRIAIPIPTSFDQEYNRRSWPQYAAAVTQSGGTPVEIPLNAPPADTARLIATCQAILLPGSPADVNPQKYGQLPDPETNPPDPARENVDELLLQDAHNLRKPIFTICFGTQMLNVWRGGTLIQHLTPMPVNHAAGPAVAIAHTAVLAPDSLLATLAAETAPPNPHPAPDTLQPPTLPINSSHHQAIAIPGDGLRITARSPHDAVVEALEPISAAALAIEASPADAQPRDPRVAPSPATFLLAVQWHPERSYAADPISRALFDRFTRAAAAWQPLAPTQSKINP